MTGTTETIEVSDQNQLVANPLVSVLMITYNHADYLAEAIEGVVSQRCEFPFELIIGEDASKDDTLKVALDYQRRYPEIIRVLHSATNVGMIANVNRVYARARGEFTSVCEGDDFWCARDKLARQAEILKKDTLVGIVHADWTRMTCKNGTWQFDLRKSVHRRVPARLLEGDLFSTWHFPKVLRTCTVMLRRQIALEMLDSELWRKPYRFGDSVQNAFVTSNWLVAYLPEVVAVYRVSPNSALRSGAAARVEFYKSCLEFDADAQAFFASRRAYAKNYRWESDMALLLWSLRAIDEKSIRFALRDMWEHFDPIEFVATGCKALWMRVPTLRRQPRELPQGVPAVRPVPTTDAK